MSSPPRAFLQHVFCLVALTTRYWVAAVLSLYGGDYCDTETFRAECGANEVILMYSARYGRMSLGRCVETEMGHIGCYRDVLAAADRRCSGRRRCEIRIPDAELENTRPCLRELKSYLEASYKCLPVTNRTSEFCRRHTELRAASAWSSASSMTSLGTAPAVGYVASVVTSDAPLCARLPWVVEVPAGQLINLTLFDFTPVDNRHFGAKNSNAVVNASSPVGRYHSESTSLSSAAKKVRKTEPSSSLELSPDEPLDVNVDSPSCRKYAVIQDGDRTFTLCGGSQRLASTYLSRSSSVRVWIMAGVSPTDMQRFVIEYAAIGCPDPQLSSDPETGTWFRRLSDHHATIGCQHNDVTWPVICRDRNWVGSAKNCSVGGVTGGSTRRHATSIEDMIHEYRQQTTHRQTPHNLFVAVLVLFTLSAAFIVIVFIVGLVQRCTRRTNNIDEGPVNIESLHRRHQAPATDHSTMMSAAEDVQATHCHRAADNECRLATVTDDRGHIRSDRPPVGASSVRLQDEQGVNTRDRQKIRRPLSGTEVGHRLPPPPPPPPAPVPVPPLILVSTSSL